MKDKRVTGFAISIGIGIVAIFVAVALIIFLVVCKLSEESLQSKEVSVKESSNIEETENFSVSSDTETKGVSSDENIDEKLRNLALSFTSDDSEDDRVIKANKLFEECINSGIIKDYKYDKVSKLYVFSYSDGTLGGFRIVEFDDALN